MKKFTETEYYKKWYTQLEEQEIQKIDKDKISREFSQLVESSGKDQTSFEEKAILFAQCIHRPQLKSPSQAVYPHFDEFDIKQIGTDLWMVSGYCDAPNSYGALTRDKFNVCMRCTGENFEYIIPKDKIHNMMLGVAIVIGFFALVALGILAPILL